MTKEVWPVDMCGGVRHADSMIYDYILPENIPVVGSLAILILEFSFWFHSAFPISYYFAYFGDKLHVYPFLKDFFLSFLIDM